MTTSYSGVREAPIEVAATHPSPNRLFPIIRLAPIVLIRIRDVISVRIKLANRLDPITIEARLLVDGRSQLNETVHRIVAFFRRRISVDNVRESTSCWIREKSITDARVQSRR